MRRKSLVLVFTLCMMFGFAGQVYAAQPTGNVESGSSEIVIETIESSQFDALEDQDDLFSAYVDKELGVSLFSDAEPIEDRGMGNRKLSGNALLLYRSMKKDIAQVADGKRESTAFAAPDQLDFTMTLKELGLEGTTEITEELKDKVASVVFERIDIDSVETYLLLDCPYDLYWYDKTRDIDMSYTINLEDNIISVTDVTLFLYPSEEYVGENADPEENPCIVNTAKTGAAHEAAAKAKEIVAQASSKSDYEKVKYYKDQICQMTSYNDEAVSKDHKHAYGNPWQLIWVFDGDEDTKVVCEGYSKAFQYLCELSSFQYDISSRIVTGNMLANDDEEPEPHMWNIVTMKDAKNYLVDVTNCDEDMIGEPEERLFLAGVEGNVDDGYYFEFDEANKVLYQYVGYIKTSYDSDLLKLADDYYDDSVKPYCDHKNVDLVDQKDPTCVAEGYTGDKICSKCGETVEEGEIIPPTGQHTWNAGEQTKAPSCIEEGEKTYTCTVCGQTKVEELAKVDHSWNAGEQTKAPSCTEAGEKTYTCTVCGQTKVEELAKADHSWDAGEQTIAPTYTTKGQKIYTCTVCGQTKTEDIPVLKNPIVKVNKIVINGLSKQIAAGKKVQLSAAIAPANANDKGIIWTSSNPKVATVSAKGLVTVKAKTGGKSVNIVATAHDGSKVKAIYVIKSMKSPVTKITGKNPKPVKVGKTVKLSAKVSAKKGANKKLKWTSSNPKFATVTNGKVKALAAGKGKTVKITAMATDGSGKKKVFKVKIK